MLCEKCGTENKDGTSYCKKCGEDLVNASDAPCEDASVTENSSANKKGVATEEDRVRTSPLAVRMQEKINKDDKKIKSKLKRGKVWATIAIIFIVLFVFENAGIILSELGYIDFLPGFEKEEEIIVEENVTEEVPAPVLGSETLSGNWNYTYSLKKNWDSDASGDYETVTETVESKGSAEMLDRGENHILAIINPGEMTVDGEALDAGTDSEMLNAWYEEGFMCMQYKGDEDKFFAPGGAEPLVIKIPVSMDEAGVVTGGVYEHTYEKVVTEMNMKYEIKVTMERK